MLHHLLASLMIVAQNPAIPPNTELPETVQQAIDRCERLEYSQPADAIRIAEHGLTLEDDLADTQRGFLKACLAWSQMQLGDMEQARELTQEVAELTDAMGESSDRVGLMMRLASLYYRGGDPIASLDVMDAALQLTEAEQLDDVLPQVLGNLAIYLTESGQYDLAVEHFERILELPQSLEAPPGALVPVRYNFARSLLLAERNERAIEQLEMLVPALRGPGLEPRLATALSMMGNGWRRLGDLEKAREFTDEAAALHETFDNPGERSALRRDQALLAIEEGDLERAEDYIRDSLALSEQIEYERSILDAQKNLVDILERQERYQAALDMHREYAERNIEFMETAQRTRLDALETELGVQRQAQELAELRQQAEIQQLQLNEESLKRQGALGALVAVLILAVALSFWQRANQKRLLKTSRTDSLTGLANRRFLTLQMEQHEGDSENAVLMLMDLDHFKQVNDRHGHDVGDRVLVEVSDLLKKIASDHDALVGRWGGEEFALYLPSADGGSAAALCDAIGRGVAGLKVKDHGGRDLMATASLGFAPIQGFNRDSGQEFWEPAMKVADQLLYRAKNEGRNRGLGAWPKPGLAPIDPLALPDALDSGELTLIVKQ
ncbi:MAG: diguanylate cyclase [Pseudomonadota bacterium]